MPSDRASRDMGVDKGGHAHQYYHVPPSTTVPSMDPLDLDLESQRSPLEKEYVKKWEQNRSRAEAASKQQATEAAESQEHLAQNRRNLGCTLGVLAGVGVLVVIVIVAVTLSVQK